MEVKFNKYTVKKLEGMPKILNLIDVGGETRHYILSDDIYVDETNKKCYVEYVGGIPDDMVIQ